MKENKDKALEKVERSDAELTREGRIYVPNTDIYEKEDAILVRCDMPGVTQEQIDIRLENTELEITATQATDAPEGYNLLSGEYETGAFRRKFNIPQLIDRDGIHARLHNGVLDVELPKAEQAKPRRIEVASG
jgi:HSP20 family molecular chaperone IbpA